MCRPSAGSGSVSFTGTFSAGTPSDLFFGTFHGLASNTARNTASGAPYGSGITITVNSGDLMIAGATDFNSPPDTWGGVSTSAPTTSYSDTAANWWSSCIGAAYWGTPTVSGSFLVAPTGSGINTKSVVAATWQ